MDTLGISQQITTQQFYEDRYLRLQEQVVQIQHLLSALQQRVDNQAVRIHEIETPQDASPAAAQTALKSQAAQQQAQDPIKEQYYVPLRSDTKPLIDLAAFARRLLNPDDLGHAVTKEVRDSARRALGMPQVREYDL